MPEKFRSNNEDRRIRGQRLAVGFPVVATVNGNPIQGFMEAVNISWSGMLIDTNFPLSVGDRIQLEFTLPESDIPITAPARVVHKIAERRPEEATQIGVTFENLEPNIQRMISGFVLENLRTD